jgi:hypothetical protein
VVSVTFALPSAARYAALRGTGAALVATVTSVDEARAAQEHSGRGAGDGGDAECRDAAR